MSLIEINRLSVRYPFDRQPALHGVTTRIEEGERVLILGPSGGGKSTLALTLNGIIPRVVEAHVEGELIVAGHSPLTTPVGHMCRQVGILFQDPETQFCMQRVEDEMVFGLENLGLPRDEMERRLVENLHRVGLLEQRTAPIQTLSGGMKQKLALAAILAMEPKILILDEPTALLDPASTEEIFQLLARLAEQLEQTLIFIEHKVDQLLPLITRVIVLGDDGVILTEGTPQHVFQYDVPLLEKHGIWIPQICRQALALQDEGMVWDPFPLTMTQWCRQLEARGVSYSPAFEGRLRSVVLDREGFQSKGQGVPTDGEIMGTGLSPAEGKEREREVDQTPVLEAEQLSFRYGDRMILDKINLAIEKGSFVAIVGPNGAGKSTLAQLLTGLLTASSGRVLLKGRPLSQLEMDTIRAGIGYVFQNPEAQFLCETVEDELAFGFKAMGWTEEEWRPMVEELLERFSLTAHRLHNPFALSQGQKRRLSVATMLSQEQEVLILDEPTYGQDQANTDALMSLLAQLNQRGKTIIMITHDMEQVARHASHVVVVAGGQIAFQGEREALFQDPELLEEAGLKLPLSLVLDGWKAAYREVQGYAGTVSTE